MRHPWLDLLTWIFIFISIAMNLISWLISFRTRRRLKALDQFKAQSLHDAFRHGLEVAAAVVGTLAERPYDCEPECSAILFAEKAIHEQIRGWNEHCKEQAQRDTSTA